MDTDERDAKRLDLWLNGEGQGRLPRALCVCALLASLLARPLFAEDIRSSAAPPPSSVEQGKALESKPPVKKTVSSLILTVKLALLADPRLFPYEIEVEATSNDVTLSGKVSTETEKTAAEKITSAVPTVKSVTNKLEVNKELSEVLAHKQDDFITHHVKERFAKSATVTAANFDVRTEQGVVSLSGTVRFQVIVLEAAEAARHVPGVKAVKTDKVRIESEG
ncbi:MAG: BON domain-containing protein [Nitrospiraceae bacterium]